MRDAAGELTDRFHLLRLPQSTLALPQRLFDMHAVADVMDHAGEVAPAISLNLADRQVQRKRRAVLAAATDLSANADDLPDPRANVVGDVTVMLSSVGLGHQHFDVLRDEFGGAVTK